MSRNAILIITLAVGTMSFLLYWHASSKEVLNSSDVEQTVTEAFPITTEIEVGDERQHNNTLVHQNNAPDGAEGGNGGMLQLTETTMQRAIAEAEPLDDEGEYIIADTEFYTLYTIEHAQLFTAVLKKTPIREAQEVLEQDLSDLLNLPKTELCRLHLDVFAPPQYDPDYSQDIGLPSCPGPREPENWKY